MSAEAEFTRQVVDAYEHLYDLVYLRTHPLAAMIGRDERSAKERAWALHHVLLEIIGELDPGPQAPVFSREWRRHRLATLRYVAGLAPQTAADQLAISRRTYYRELNAAMEAIAGILWSRYGAEAMALAERSLGEEDASSERRGLLLSEAARMAQHDLQAGLGGVVEGVLALLHARLEQRGLEVRVLLPEMLPPMAADPSLLRQLVLGMLGHLVERMQQAQIRLEALVEGQALRLALRAVPPAAVRPTPAPELAGRIASLQELATLGAVRILPLRTEQAIVGFDLLLPTGPPRTVLVVDDNQDVLELFQRYLITYGYHVVTAQAAAEALPLACELQPHAITLDLMMPDQDGWDVLQTLLNQPSTRHIPIIVCSVLKESELALSLGAAAFLEKPVTGQALLAALAALDEV